MVVQVLRSYTGRGPTKAWTSIDTDLVVCVLHDSLTKGEQSLAGDGRGHQVRDMRKAYQEVMGPELIAGVEEITGREVIAFLSDNHVEPDIAIETFVLRPQTDGRNPAPAGSVAGTAANAAVAES
jgi:uncharacterized protein YbcI